MLYIYLINNSLEDLQWNENIRYLVSRSSQGEVIRVNMLLAYSL